jgi:hypothetical protein
LHRNSKKRLDYCADVLTAVKTERSVGKSHLAKGARHFDTTFSGALGELRGVFGIHIALIAVKNKLDVEDDLAFASRRGRDKILNVPTAPKNRHFYIAQAGRSHFAATKTSTGLDNGAIGE